MHEQILDKNFIFVTTSNKMMDLMIGMLMLFKKHQGYLDTNFIKVGYNFNLFRPFCYIQNYTGDNYGNGDIYAQEKFSNKLDRR